MAKNLRTNGVCLLGLGLIALTGCLPEDDLSDLEVKAPSPSISVPLLNTNLSVTDIISIEEGEGLLTENDDRTYRILYQSQAQTPPIGEFFPEIPNQYYSEQFSLGVASSAFSGRSSVQQYPGTIPIEVEDFDLYALESKQGRLDITLRSDYRHDVEVSIVFPSIKHRQDTTVLTWGPKLIPVINVSKAITAQFALSDYTVELIDGEIPYRLEVVIDGSRSGESIDKSDAISLDVALTNLDFGYMAGNFSGIDLPMDADTLLIPVLANAANGSVALNPTLRMQFTNSYGASVLADFSQVSVKQQGGNQVGLEDRGEHSFFSEAYNFPFMARRDTASATQTQIVDQSTSNIQQAFAELPYGLLYHMGFTLNDASEDTSFVTDQSQIGVDITMELPLEGTFDIVLEDTIPVDFNDLEDVEEFKLLIKTENSFPLDAELQVYFLDENKQLITDAEGPLSLFSNEKKFLTAARLQSSETGETSPVSVDMPLVATLSQDAFERVRSATHLLVRTDLESVNEEKNGFIKLYSFYNIRFSLATQIKTSLD